MIYFEHELKLITHPHILEMVTRCIGKAPKKFWRIAASMSGKYHSPDECGEGGTYLHTKRVVSMVKVLAPAYGIEGIELEQCYAAAILHDLVKYGEGDDHKDFGPREAYLRHGPAFLDWYTKEFGPPYRPMTVNIIRLVTCHMGKWSPEGYKPVTNMEWCVHMADYIASRAVLSAAIPLMKGEL